MAGGRRSPGISAIKTNHGRRRCRTRRPTRSWTRAISGSRTSLYRNDWTTNAKVNPHSFLLYLRTFATAAMYGQIQVAAFLRSGQVIDPDAGGNVWEVPISDPALLLPLNYSQPALRP